MSAVWDQKLNKTITRLVLIFVMAFPGPLQASDAPIQQVKTPETSPLIFNREDALTDPQNKISDEFAVPEELKKRTAFWFDIYTKYGSSDHVIHHVLYPWVVFKIVDTSPIADSNAHRYTKYNRTRQEVRKGTWAVRLALSRLAKLNSYKKLTPLEMDLVEALKDVPGPRKKVYRAAVQNVRVQLGQKDFFMSGLESSAKYLPFMESAFQESGLPVELTRLPFVESSFNEGAESKVGASGIWQIMPRSGRQYLIVNNHIDERNSPLKASLAAIQIFKSNFRQLKSWPLAVTAYNHGAGGIRLALKRARATELTDLVDRYHRGAFKFASANFYTCFLAALHAERYHEQIFAAAQLQDASPLEHHIVYLEKPLRVKKLLQVTGLTKSQLLEYNFDLKDAARSNSYLPRGYRLILPPAAKEYLNKQPSGPASSLREASLELRTKASG